MKRIIVKHIIDANRFHKYLILSYFMILEPMDEHEETSEIILNDLRSLLSLGVLWYLLNSLRIIGVLEVLPIH